MKNMVLETRITWPNKIQNPKTTWIYPTFCLCFLIISTLISLRIIGEWLGGFQAQPTSPEKQIFYCLFLFVFMVLGLPIVAVVKDFYFRKTHTLVFEADSMTYLPAHPDYAHIFGGKASQDALSSFGYFGVGKLICPLSQVFGIAIDDKERTIRIQVKNTQLDVSGFETLNEFEKAKVIVCSHITFQGNEKGDIGQ